MPQAPADSQLSLDRRSAPLGRVGATIDGLALAFASVFAPTGSQVEKRPRYELLLLILILAAATFVRFWGLGNVGLHGDEETTAMPALHLLEDGRPLFPSGMFYPRSMSQLYMIAASVQAFGHTEWALRLPSALCGVLLVLLSYFLGRRFLSVGWNLAFTAAVAFLPDFIVSAQTARMYVFFVTSVAAFLLLLFQWERTDRTAYLLGAVAALGVGLEFHTLTVFSAPLLLYPGLVQADRRKLVLGILAFAAVVCGFLALDWWIGTAYPETAELEGVGPMRNGPKAAWAVPQLTPLLLAGAALAAASVTAYLARGIAARRRAILAGSLLAGGLVAQILFSYHIAALLIVAGLIVAERGGHVPRRRLLVLAGVCAAIAISQLVLLRSSGVESLRLIVGATTGWPSIWPYLVIAHYSIVAALIVAAAAVAALWQLARCRPVPDFILFVALGVWVPLLLIGLIKWWVQDRYLDGQALPLLLGAFAGAQWLFARVGAGSRGGVLTHAIAAVFTCVLVVDPRAVARVVPPSYATNPDHKGAAQFIQSLHIRPHDIVLAEDVLQQTYYLGRVDYWLVAKNVAAQFVHELNGRVLEFYTNTPVIGTGAELRALIDRRDRGTVYVIGSGENQEDGRGFMRAHGIAQVMASPRFEVIFEGRDGLTKVWRVRPPGSDALTAVQAQRAHR